jgi:malate dehydrogenase (oxaloacetate-decarboxylating)(NADP+)
MPIPDSYNASLEYHKQSPAGKLSVTPTKPMETQGDLAKAYSPGVAGPVLAIAESPATAYDYTSKGNLVGIVSNGTAILGLGNLGALASKPVMEGKAVLFKKFAGIDAFDIELNSTDPKAIIEAVAMLEPTFGGINLEDIKAPDCFEIEQALLKRMRIPLMHDDQHGTAVVASAALLNALHIGGKKLSDVSVVLNGAGAAGVAIAHMLLALGVAKEQLTLCDSQGVIHSGRLNDLDASKVPFAKDSMERSLEDAMEGSDVFIGVSKAKTVSPAMLQSMSKNPVVLALANPEPEIPYQLARDTRPDAIIATGRSDHPNQVNNVLCFPFLFRAALDTRATAINDAMKKATVTALAELAREPVPSSVLEAYELASLAFGPEYILPKPLDPRSASPPLQQQGRQP